MVGPQKHIIQRLDRVNNYVKFSSATAFHAFVDSEFKRLSDPNAKVWQQVQDGAQKRLLQGSNWYGVPGPITIKELESHRSFSGMALAASLKPRIQAHLHRSLAHVSEHIMPLAKLAYNDYGLGLFSYDRAAMGLYPAYPVNTATPLDTVISQLGIATGRTVFHTKVKKVYAFFENRDTENPSLQLYLLAGGNAKVEGQAMWYTGLACGELTEFLARRGVGVKVHILFTTCMQHQVVAGMVCVKPFASKLDKNLLLLLSSDPKYFRYRGFKALIALGNYFGVEVPPGLGRITPELGKELTAALGEDGYVFEQCYSLEGAATQVMRIIESYTENRKNAKVA